MMKPIIPDAALTQHLIVLGKTGSGKSSVLRLLVEAQLAKQEPVCIIDPKGDWWGIKSSADGRRQGFPVVIFGGEHADVPINAHAGAQVAELYATGNRPCLIDLGGWMPGDRTRFFIDFASTLFRHTRGPRWLVVDEVHNFAPQGKVMDPDAGKMLHWANRIITEGRGKGVTVLSASQRPQKVHKDFVTSNETLIAMRVIHELDRNAMKAWIDGCGDPVKGKEVLASLANMKRGEGWVWSPEIGFGPKQITFPMFATYDSFAPQTSDADRHPKGWAEVDLEEVKTTLAGAIEKAKQEDPKALRAEIAQLKRAATQTGPSPAELAAEYTRGREDGFEAALAGLSPIIDRTETLRAAIDEQLGGFVSDLRQRAAATPTRTTPARQPARTAAAPAPRAHRPSATPSQPLEGVSRSQQKILEALAMLEAMGIAQPSRTQLALWAEVSPTSGGYFNNLGALRTAGLIDYPSGGTVALTDAGRERAPTPQALSVEEMQESLCAKVGASKAAIVRALIEIYPKHISRDDLAEKIGVSATSGGYFNNLGALRTLGVIDYPSPGQVVALPVLFLE